uniref:Uncharacterized protein n=1 Tax=Anguilla anguilla TaxID=7936 RepID=A0A0E9SGJ5_ANGAN
MVQRVNNGDVSCKMFRRKIHKPNSIFHFFSEKSDVRGSDC